ncbi:hypothetical protein ACIGBL_14120 [Streptomyces sp. NPDC085614]|uniref:hypothetical protein n=1 Tax=Streptomyces sp. NPDC085614 TaxID=3365733 RepID=UPI0037CDFE54
MRRQRSLLTVVALCLGGALTACDGGDGEGYAAVGAGSSPNGPVAPSGTVTLIPLDGPSGQGTASPRPGSPGTSPPGTTPAAGGGPGSRPGGSTSPGGGSTGTSPGGGSTGTSPGGGTSAPTPGRPGTTAPATTIPPAPGTTSPAPAPAPAALVLSTPTLADGDQRWCERVTVAFHNTGGSPATSGTVTFATHVIGALGVDWATLTSTQPLPAPIAAGTTRTQTYTVCVDSWRVPLGMHIDTKKVTANWG